MSKYVERWGFRVEPTSAMPGVFRREGGGFVIRGSYVIRKSGVKRVVCRSMPEEKSVKDAFATLQLLKRQGRAGELDGAPPSTIPIWRTFAASLFASKVDAGDIASAKGAEKWANVIGHLARAPWAGHRVDAVERQELKAWRNSLPSLVWTRTKADRATGEEVVIKSGNYAPETLNNWLSIARVIFKEAADTYDFRDPMAGIDDFDMRTWRTYSREEPNSLTPQECAAWLAKFRELYPQHYALVLLGLATGQRPSTLRPLRRGGPNADLNLATGVLLIRRSHTLGQEVMESTKTARQEKKNDTEVMLPKSVLDVLRWHVARLEAPPVPGRLSDPDGGTWQQRQSELLFPSTEGKLLCRSVLAKPFAAVTKACGLTKTITPRAMRRTFQDLTRAADVDGVVAMAISGHATDAMRVRYSTAATPEVASAIAKVVSIATARPRKTKKAG